MTRRPARLQIAVIGAANADDELRRSAERVGRAIAEAGATLLTGGGGGVMRAAWQGAHEAGGRTVAIRPDTPPIAGELDAYDVRLFTGMGQARNVVLTMSADAVVAVGGGWGTLSEIALASKHGVPVVLLDSWRLEHDEIVIELDRATDPETAVQRAIERAHNP